MSYSDLVISDIRATILRALAEDPGYSHNDIVLTDICRMMGHTVSRDAVRTQLAWLSEQGLVKTETVNDAIVVATLTDRGADVASGAASVPGVKRPRPGM